MTIDRAFIAGWTIAAAAVMALAAGCPQPTPVPPGPDVEAGPPVPPEAAPPADAPAPKPPALDGPVVVIDAAPGSCAAACAALTAAGCAEGRAVNCIGRMQAISDGRSEQNPANNNYPVTCADISKVHSAADVRAAGQRCTLDGGS